MRLEALLRSHGFMRVERPPELWEAQAEDPRREVRAGTLQRLAERLADAGVRYAYTRSFDGQGTITVFLARKA